MRPTRFFDQRGRRTPILNSTAAGDGRHNQKGLGPRRDRLRQGGVRQFMGEVLLAREEPHKRLALVPDVIADRPAQHRIAGLEGIEDRALRGPAINLKLHFAVEVRQHQERRREHDSDHGNVWTSTESTAGRSRTMGAQLSPASAEAYTCPPVVPK